MKWFDNWFAKKCKQAWDNAQTNESDETIPTAKYPSINTVKPSRISRASELSSRSTTFNLYNANGGYVIELRTYNSKIDEWDNSLHIIPNGQELGKSIEHIITLEALKK